LGLKALTDAALGGDLRRAGLAVLLLALVGVAWRVAGGAALAARLRLGERAGMVLQRRLGALAAAIPTVEHFERPDYLRAVDQMRRDSGWLADGFAAAVQHASAVAQLALTVGLLATLHPALALLPLFGLPSLVAGHVAQRTRQGVSIRVAEWRRLERHLQDLAWGEPASREVRVFGLGPELLRRHVAVRGLVDRAEDLGNVRIVLVTAVGWLAFAVGFLGAMVLVVQESLAGRATVGDVVLALTLAGQVNGRVAGLAGTVAWATHGADVVRRYLWLVAYAAGSSRPAAPAAPAAPVPTRLREGITLREVSFVYPGTEKVVLEGISVHLPAGATVALVGENGAGKSTLVKLLLRLYEAQQGQVLVDGADLRRLDVAAWRARTAAGFQDFARFELRVRESVGVGEVRLVEDAQAVSGALRRAQAGDLAGQLPRGLETRLGRPYKGGTTLSQGQWQKVALGRAMMRRAPLLLVLDEPTAALDAPSEQALFARFAGAARGAAADGGITLLVSHRFSTVRLADLILVLDGGRLREGGSHAELLAAGGLYAELYELQARAYR
ncbi:MAG TPA: ABC transporter ATP-binding protein, partial [Chloroflexota bacterium]|nr:ABC transporter ATP-binding protein [Chloroflexota bacterium]